MKIPKVKVGARNSCHRWVFAALWILPGRCTKCIYDMLPEYLTQILIVINSSGCTSCPSPAANPWMNRHFSTQTAAKTAKIWTGKFRDSNNAAAVWLSFYELTPRGLSCVLFADFCFQTASAPGKCASFCGFDMVLTLKTALLESLHAVCCFSFPLNLHSVGATQWMGWDRG